ncbi:tetratricopeptide repeat protein [Bradyrhizobium betae]|uniref:protein O-GlcNAc transferase n=1 Tax=Bradyrhizobium betae TaxID=244734 RepID=A0A5P6PCV7_9BRAD|nr:tetratricopeptide repeat protein [Bradyrhizobium betae]MCS3729697.1 putative O-linked N-acetylglucosamine transferase (SPINDLY family) [Bradyrhizobium betae]QFI76076.1 tetratricopeptide repeat protein [Bradyrhizobium betae]
MRDEAQILDRALSLHNKGDITGAAKLYQRIIRTNPGNLHAVHFLGLAEAASGNIARAKLLMQRSLQANPANLQFFENYAAVLHRAGEHDELIRLCQHGLQLSPNSLELLHAAGAGYLALGRFAEAIERLTRLVAHHPRHFPAHFMLGSALAKTRQYEPALAAYERALRLRPELAEAHLDIGTIHFTNGRHGEALLSYDRARALRPDLAEASLGRCHALIQLGRREDALAAADEALRFRADLAEAWVARGNALLDLDRRDDAEAAYDRALAIGPEFAAGWSGKGNVLLRSGRQQDAETAFDRAIAADADFAEAWLGRGTLALSLGRHVDALAALDRATALNPSLAGAWLAKGQVAYLEKRYDEALAAWTRTLALNPDQPSVAAACLRVRMHLCDWSGFEAACTSLRTSVQSGKIISPFMFVAVPSTPAEQLRCARTWIGHNFRNTAPAIRSSYGHGRIRLAYLSADFHQHATSQLMAGVFEHHDRARFEVTAISIGPNDGSDMRRRIEAAFDRFVDAKPRGDAEVAELARSLQIDILVDLKGFTQDARTAILAMRPAPIQVNYLGFPGTIGADFIDYVIADRHVIPEHDVSAYAEKVVWLPESYQANDRNRAVADVPAVRAAHGLADDAFVFCCFNDNYKITPDVFSSWMRILTAVDNGVLWLFEDNPGAADNLRREAAARGIAPQRLVFAGRLPTPEHLARHRCADLFLDTLPYGAHTTASDALWTCLPVLTCLGDTFAGRVGASLLHAIGLPELVTTTPAAYERLAIDLAHDAHRLATLRAKLALNRLRAPLYDTARYTRDLETAYAAMMERHLAGLPPDHIRVPGTAECP